MRVNGTMALSFIGLPPCQCRWLESPCLDPPTFALIGIKCVIFVFTIVHAHYVHHRYSNTGTLNAIFDPKITQTPKNAAA